MVVDDRWSLDLWDHAVPPGRHQARPTVVRHGPRFVRRLGARGPAVPGMPRRGLARGVVARALDRRRYAHRASLPRAAEEPRAGNRLATRSTDRHRAIHPSGPTHGGSGECAGGLPTSHLVGVGTARGGTG